MAFRVIGMIVGTLDRAPRQSWTKVGIVVSVSVREIYRCLRGWILGSLPAIIPSFYNQMKEL